MATFQAPPTTDPKAQLIQSLKGELQKLITADIRGDVDREKMFLYSAIRKHEFYWRGDQNIAPQFTGGSTFDWSRVSGNGNVKYSSADEGAIDDYVVNDFRGYGRKFCAVLQRPPNVRAVPNDRENHDHIRRSQIANRLIPQLRALWKVEKKNRQMGLIFYKVGPAFVYTPYTADGDKWGYTSEPVMEVRPVEISPASLYCQQCGTSTPIPENPLEAPQSCPDCQKPFGPEDVKEPETMDLPQVVGETKYANGMPEFHVRSAATVTTIFDIEGLGEAPWLIDEYESHKGVLLEKFPQLHEVLKNTEGGSYKAGGAASLGRMARDATTMPSGAAYTGWRKNRWLYSRIWLRPSMYELCLGSSTTASGEQEVRKALKENFPTGLKMTWVEDELVDLEEERLDRVWAVGKSDLSEKLYSDPYCKDFDSSQDEINDAHNMAEQMWERSLPVTAFDVSKIDLNEWKRFGFPSELLPVTPGTVLDNIMKPLQMAKPDPQMGEWIDNVREHAAEIIGMQRAMFGASLPNETAHQAELNKNMAMAQVNPVWSEMSECHAQATQNAILQFAEHSQGKMPDPINPDSAMMIEDYEELLQGGWHCEAAPDMPMTWAERRAWLMDMMKSTPTQILSLFGFDDEENIEQLQEIVGVPDWKVKNQNARDKVYWNIRQLLQGQAMPQMDGTFMPSIPADQWEDDHQFVVMVVRDWSQGPTGRYNKQKNPDGYANVIAWGTQHMKMALPPPGMEPLQPTGGGPPPPPGTPKTPPTGPAPPANAPSPQTKAA